MECLSTYLSSSDVTPRGGARIREEEKMPNEAIESESGLSVRDYFAGCALQALLGQTYQQERYDGGAELPKPRYGANREDRSALAWEAMAVAEAMMKEREKCLY
jgi:hypothetical protein